MRCFFKSIVLVAISLALVMLLESTAAASTLTIPAGTDLLQTIPGSPPASGTFADGTLPAGFFGPGSDPFIGRIFLEGQPTGPLGHTSTPFVPVFNNPEVALLAQHGVLDARSGGGLPSTDTIVQRNANAILPSIGSTDTVPIEILSLSLVSTQPITVTYQGGTLHSFFDVFVDLDPQSIQPLGSMNLTRTTNGGGTFSSLLPVISRITFTNTSPTGPPALGSPVRQDLFINQGGTFHIIPLPAAFYLGGLGLLGIAAREWLARRRS